MKLVKKLIIILFAIVSIITHANSGICSDNTAAAQQPQPAAQVSQPVAVPQQTATQPQQQAAPVQQQPQTSPITPPNNNQGFLPSIMNMISVLLKVIVLILILGGIIVLYKRSRSGGAFKLPALNLQKPKKGTPEEAGIITEPSDVSEAVSSFIKHRIKR